MFWILKMTYVDTIFMQLPLLIMIFQDILVHFAYIWKILVHFHMSSDLCVERMQHITLSHMICSLISLFAWCLFRGSISLSLPKVKKYVTLLSRLSSYSKVKTLLGYLEAIWHLLRQTKHWTLWFSIFLEACVFVSTHWMTDLGWVKTMGLFDVVTSYI